MDFVKVKALKAGQTFYGVNMAGGWSTIWGVVRRDLRGRNAETSYLVCRVKTLSNPGGVSLSEGNDDPCWYNFGGKDYGSMRFTLCRGQAIRWAEEATRERQRKKLENEPVTT